MGDWPENERPVAFIHEKIDYPKGMFHVNFQTSKQKQGEAGKKVYARFVKGKGCLLYTSPSPRDRTRSRMPSSA